MSLFDEITNRNANQNQIKKKDDEGQKSSMSLFDEITSGQKSSMSLFDEITSGQNTSDDNFSTFDTKSTFDTSEKKIGSTVAYTSGKLITGATGVFEGIADAGAWVLKGLGKLTSWMVDNPVGAFVFGEDAGDFENNPLYQIGNDMVKTEIVKEIDTALDKSKAAEQSYVEPGSLGANIASGVGQVGGMILTGNIFGTASKVSTVAKNATKAQKILNAAKIAITNPTTKSMFVSTFGNSYSQASNNGADDLEATLYGLLNATKETGTEMIYGGLGAAFGKGALDDVAKEGIEKLIYSKLGETVKAKLLAKTSQLGISMFAEGAEEVLATLLDPFVESVYTHKLDFSAYNSILDDFITGALVSGVLETGSNIVNLKGKSPEEVVAKIQEQSTVEKLNTISKQTATILNSKNVDLNTKVDRINNQIDILTDQMTQFAPIGTIDIEGIYSQKVELMKKRDELISQMSEENKITVVDSLNQQVSQILNAPEGTLDENTLNVVDDKVKQIDKLTNEIDKDKKIKVLANKQTVKINQEQYKNDAQSIINQLNMNIPESQEQIQIVTELNDEQHQIQDLGSIFGKQIVFTKNMNSSGAVTPNNANLIFIDINAKNSLITTKGDNATMLYVTGHELFHSLQMSYPEIYTQFVDYVKSDINLQQIVDFMKKYDVKDSQKLLSNLKIDGKFDLEAVKQNPKKYAIQNTALNSISEEMVANEFGGMISDKSYMNKLYNDNPSLFKKVIDAIKKLFESLTGPIYDSSLTQLQVEKIRNDFENIVSEIGQKNETKTEQKTASKEIEYRYHNTSPDAIENIGKKGLLPNEGQYGKGVYFAPTVEGTEDWYGDKGAVLRIDKNNLDSYDEFDDQGWNDNIVPSNLLEVSYDKGKTWKPLKENEIKKPATTKIQESEIKQDVIETKKSSEYQIPEIIYRGERTTQIKGQGLPIYGEGLYFTSSEKRAANFGTVKEYDSKTLKFEKPYIQGTQYNDKMLSILNEYVEKHPEKQSELKLILNNGKPLTKSFMSPSEIKQAYLDAGYDSFIRDSKGQEEYVMFAQRDLGMKTTQMSLEDRYASITKNFDRYNNEKTSENKKIILNSLLKSYQNYKKDGGTETNVELENIIDTENKNKFKDEILSRLKLKQLPMNEKLTLDDLARKYNTKQEFMDAINILYADGWKGNKNVNADEVKKYFENYGFHGTNAVTEIKNEGFKVENKYFNDGVYFAETPDMAIEYMNQNRSRSNSIKDVFVIDLQNFKLKTIDYRKFREVTKGDDTGETLVNALKKQGYDGIQYSDNNEGQTLIWNKNKLNNIKTLDDIWNDSRKNVDEVNFKLLPKAMPLTMKRQLFNREITIPEGMSLGEAINIYRKNPNNKRLLTRTIEPVEYAKDVTRSDIGKVLELNRVEVLNPEKIEWDRATGMFGKGMYFSLTKGTTRYYQNEYKDAKYLVDKYDVDTKDMFILQQEQIYDDNGQYLYGRYDVYARDELSNAMIKQGILTEQERNEIKNKNNHFVQTYNEMLKEKGYKGIAVFVHPTDNKNGEVTCFGGNQLVLFDTSKAIRKQSEGFVGKEYYPGYERDKIKYLPKNENSAVYKESRFYANTATNSELFEDVVKLAQNNKDLRNYLSTTHNIDMQKAIEKIQTQGGAAINDFFMKDRLDSVDIQLGKFMLSYYKAKGDITQELSIYNKIRTEATKSAQYVESMKVFKEISPAAIVNAVQNDITRAIDELQNSSDPTIRAWLNENIGKATLTPAEREWIYQMANKASKLDFDSPEYRKAYALINAFVADRIPKSISAKVKGFRRMGMLFNPKTMTRNFLGNKIMEPINRYGADVAGTFLDKRLAKLSGVRTQGMLDAKAYKQGKRQGVQESIDDRKLGINTSRTNPFEMQQGRTWNDKGVGKILNWMEKWMNYYLNRGDRPFEEAIYQNSLANQMKLNSVTEATETMKQIAQEEAEKKTWKNSGLMARKTSQVRQLLNTVHIGDLGLGDMALPFIMTPANLMVATYDYSPAAMITVAKKAVEFKNALKTGKDVALAQKALVDSFGKATAGTLIYAVAYALAKAGLISGGEDEDKDIRAAMRAQGYQPYSIKIGDMSFSYDWAQPIANPFATMAELQRQSEMNKSNPNSDEANNVFKAISEAFTIGGDRLYEQSFLQSLNALLSAESPKDGIIDFATELPQSFVPTLLKQIADMTDGNVKATYDSNNLLSTMFAKTMNKIPGLKSLLPNKKDVLGNDIEAYGGYNNIFNVMFNPSNISKDVMGNIGDEISDVYNHTGESGVMPQVAVTSFDYDTNDDGIKERITFNTTQQSQLQELMGNIVSKSMSTILNNSVYINSSYDEKATALISLMEYSKAKALEQSGLIENYEIKSGNAFQINKYVNSGLGIGDAVMYDSMINPIESLKDANGETIDGSQNGQKAYTIMNMQISDNAKNIMLQLISPTAKTPETVDSLSALGTVQQFIDYYSLSRRDTTIINHFSRDDYDVATSYFSISGSQYTQFANDVGELRADYDSKGKVIEGSKKKKVVEYINSLPLSQYQKIYLYSISGYSVKQWKNELYSYVNGLNISVDEKYKIWTSMGLD